LVFLAFFSNFFDFPAFLEKNKISNLEKKILFDKNIFIYFEIINKNFLS